MSELYIMVGAPGSGKSSYVKNVLKKYPDVKWVSRDKIRFDILEEEEYYFAKETKVFHNFTCEILDALNNYPAVFADATHLTPASRAKLFNALKLDLIKNEVIAVVMKTPFNECIRRNELRKGTKTYVPISTLRKMFFSQKEPTFKEYNGIFNKIFHVFPDGKIKEFDRR